MILYRQAALVIPMNILMLTTRLLVSMVVLLLCLVTPELKAETKVITLSNCIETALMNQPAIRSARENVNAGQGRVTQAASPYLPQLRASTGYSESHSLGGAFGNSISKSYTTSVSLNQTLYDFGRTGNALDAARFGTRSLEFDEQRVVQETILSVKQAYYALLAAKHLVLVAQKTIEQAESHFRQAEAFFQSGAKPRFDVTRTEVEVNNAKLGMITASNNVRLRTIGLYNAMGIDPERDIEIDDTLSSAITVPPMEQALAESIKNRPEMRKTEADIQAAQARVKAEESNYLPTLSANGAYNWSHGTQDMGSLPNGTPLKGDIQNSWNAGVSLSMPLFEGGLTRGRISEARANLHALEAQGRSYRQSILIELNQAYADIESAAARIAVMELSVKKAQENLELAQGRYQAGVGPYIEVTDAQVASVNAETDHVQALYDYQLAAARLFKAMGTVTP